MSAPRRSRPGGGRLSCVVSPYDDLPSEPLSDHFGFDRGTPLDRHYIESFLAERRSSIQGAVLEVQDDTYTQRFGSRGVTATTVIDIDATNPKATLIADLGRRASLPADMYDCIILTQTLHLLQHPGRCLKNCYQALRSGGVLLASAPTLGRVSPTYPDGDYWRFTPAGINELFTRCWEGESTTHSWGNLRSCMGFLMGAVIEDFPSTALEVHDPRFVLTVGVEARKR